MNLIVVWKPVPDPVEDLAIASDGRSLEMATLRFKLGDADEHALEEALLLKEQHGGRVTVVTLGAPEVDEQLFSALAKGADRAVKARMCQAELGTAATARVLADFIASPAVGVTPDTLILPGSQAIDDLEGELAALLAEKLGLPYLGVVCGISPADGKVIVQKEFAGGARGEFEVALPAVLGIQSAEKPPRYVPVARIRAAMRSTKIEIVDLPPPETPKALEVARFYKPDAAGHAEMFEGAPEEVAERLVGILAERGII